MKSSETMNFSEIVQRTWRRVELMAPLSGFRIGLLRLRGATIGTGTSLGRIYYTWPHQIFLGKRCVICRGVYFNYNHYWVPGPRIKILDGVFVGEGVEFNIREGLRIGNHTLVGAGSRFIDHDHGTKKGTLIKDQEQIHGEIVIGNDVWIGANCLVLKGVTIGNGAILGAGSVLTQSVGENEIWAGVPARLLRRK